MRHAYSILPLVLLHALCACEETPVPPVPADPEVAAALHQRLDGDRTHACIAAAVVDTEVRRAIVCADGGTRSLSTSSSFEIGSISKTMTGFLLADLEREGLLSLDDTLAMHLPEGTTVPTFEGQPILLKHVVTHTAGLPALPPRMVISNPNDPYAALTEAVLLDSLGDVTLDAAPGTRWAYSNFGFMVLSYVITRTADESLETLLRTRLFEPVGMTHAFIAEAPRGVRNVQGHATSGRPAGHWHFPDRMAGVGGVRASLDDMVAYARAVLGEGDEHVASTIGRALEPIALAHDGPPMGMAWTLPVVADHMLAAHDGGTGGFASLLLVDRANARAMVLLVDTAFANLGEDISLLGVHLFDPAAFPAPGPRTIATPSSELLSALSGEYAVADFIVSLGVRDDRLRARVDGSDAIDFRYDSYGDFFSDELEGILRPVVGDDGQHTFDLVLSGHPFRAERIR